MDNPAEYVAQLEVDLRRARALNAQLKSELADADTLRSAVASGAVDAAQNMKVACDRLELWRPVVDAAIDWEKQERVAPDSDPDVVALLDAVQKLNRVNAKRPQS